MYDCAFVCVFVLPSLANERVYYISCGLLSEVNVMYGWMDEL